MLTDEERKLGKIMHIKDEDIDIDKIYMLLKAHKQYPKEYQAFRRMKNRATNKNNPKYETGYGRRGICSEWLAPYGFLDFINDVGPMPSYEKNGKVLKWSIDRIDNNVGYYKGNCRWATASQQIRNRSNTVWVDIDGEHLELTVALNKYGVPRGVFHARRSSGWSDEKALKTKVANRAKRNNKDAKIESKPINPATRKPYTFGIRKYAVKGDRLELIGEVKWT